MVIWAHNPNETQILTLYSNIQHANPVHRICKEFLTSQKTPFERLSKHAEYRVDSLDRMHSRSRAENQVSLLQNTFTPRRLRSQVSLTLYDSNLRHQASAIHAYQPDALTNRLELLFCIKLDQTRTPTACPIDISPISLIIVPSEDRPSMS